MKAGIGHSLEDEPWAQAWAPLVPVSIRVASECLCQQWETQFLFFLVYIIFFSIQNEHSFIEFHGNNSFTIQIMC